MDGNYKQKSKEFDGFWLLEQAEQRLAGVKDVKNTLLIVRDKMIDFLLTRQFENESVHEYMNRFNQKVKTLKAIGGEFVLCNPAINGMTWDTLYDAAVLKEDRDTVMALSSEAYEAVCFITGTHDGRFAELKKRLEHNKALGRDEYPRNMQAAYQLVMNTAEVDSSRRYARRGRRGRNRDVQVNFAQNRSNVNEQLVPGRDGITYENVTCWTCRRRGHYSGSCPGNDNQNDEVAESNEQGVNLLQGEVEEQSGAQISLPNSWILLDSCSSDTCSNNKQMVKNIRKCRPNEVLELETNGGSIFFDEIGMMKMLPIKAYYNPKSIATIISFKDVMNLSGARIQFDSDISKTITVTYKGNKYDFSMAKNGIFVYDSGNKIKNTFENKHTCALMTVKDNEKKYTKADILKARSVTNMQEYFFWPGTEQIKKYLSNNQLINCRLSEQDMNTRNDVYGSPSAILKGKMVRTSPLRHNRNEVRPVFDMIGEKYRDVHIFLDMFYVNRNIFLHTKSENINYRSVQSLETRKTTEIAKGMSIVKRKYEKRGFKIMRWHADSEFNNPNITEVLEPGLLEVYPNKEHVGFIERSIREIKERARATCQNLPYRRLTKLMTKELIFGIVTALNTFANENDINSCVSPGMIIDGRGKPDMNVKRISFGAFAYVYTETSNTMAKRSVPAIALRPSNENGGHYFMNVETGKRLNSFVWKEVPIPDSVIASIEKRAKIEKQPEVKNGNLHFEWRYGMLEDDIEDDEESVAL